MNADTLNWHPTDIVRRSEILAAASREDRTRAFLAAHFYERRYSDNDLDHMLQIGGPLGTAIENGDLGQPRIDDSFAPDDDSWSGRENEFDLVSHFVQEVRHHVVDDVDPYEICRHPEAT